MRNPRFSLRQKDNPVFIELLGKTNHKTAAIWAIDCTERVLPYFEKKYPKDHRPRQAIKMLQKWIDTGLFSMSVIRKASLDSHAAAREVGKNNSARSAARAAVSTCASVAWTNSPDSASRVEGSIAR